ncbi:hypothetical protein [Actinoplanes solisilvae]|uniref:hypothetical protein n=1 Tax=Actinoplanes solisilvae TaxID=2486853 RepID=UPI0013E3AE47|nr:hypothetical protein [Actinoplanes solisilvae]
MPTTVHDVAILCDFRFAGAEAGAQAGAGMAAGLAAEAGAGVAAEVRAQAEAALSTVLIHVPDDERPLPFAPLIRDCLRDGAATLAREDKPVSVRLLVVRGTRRLTRGLPELRADRTVVVADEPPVEAFRDAEWAPLDTRVRAAMPIACRLTPHDWHEIEDVSGRWRDLPAEDLRALERRRGHQSHLRRLASFGVRPRISAPAGKPRTEQKATRRVLMVGDDDAALRLTAIARRLPGDLAPILATEGQISEDGFLTEHFPSRAAFDFPYERWTRLVRDRLAHLIDLHRPEIVAVDGVPHEGVVEAVREHTGVVWVWIRRPMWQRGAGQEYITEGKVFDHVLEPGEFAALADDGATVDDRATAHRVEPITMLDAGDLLDAAAARAELGLNDELPAALLRFDAPAIEERLKGHGFQVVRTDRPGRCLRAFDLVVSTASYDAAHEQIRFGIPTVFVPDPTTPLDDQVGRARYAEAAGVALSAADEDLDKVLDAAARTEVRAALRRRCEELTFANGARAAATWLSGRVRNGG